MRFPETYPKLVATKVVGKASYKTDDSKKVTAEHRKVRKRIVDAIRAADESIIRKQYAFYIVCEDALADSAVNDPSGDILDALLCSLQAAWAWSRRNPGYGIPANFNKLEGWITDPELLEA